MLALSRKKSERVVIHYKGKIIATLEVTEIDGNKVKLAFDADKSIGIDREEIYRLREEQGQTTNPKGS